MSQITGTVTYLFDGLRVSTRVPLGTPDWGLRDEEWDHTSVDRRRTDDVSTGRDNSVDTSPEGDLGTIPDRHKGCTDSVRRVKVPRTTGRKTRGPSPALPSRVRGHDLPDSTTGTPGRTRESS